MAVIYSDTIGCNTCGSDEFRQETRLLFHHKVRRRESNEQDLPYVSKRIAYLCVHCGEELDR